MSHSSLFVSRCKTLPHQLRLLRTTLATTDVGAAIDVSVISSMIQMNHLLYKIDRKIAVDIDGGGFRSVEVVGFRWNWRSLVKLSRTYAKVYKKENSLPKRKQICIRICRHLPPPPPPLGPDRLLSYLAGRPRERGNF